MNLQQQLEYIYDRGYWSIVKNRTRGHYFMVSTKDEYGKLHCHGYAETKELATKYSHAFTLDNFLRGEDIENLEIVDTIHPSELMGKGFQVGDKVKVTGDPCGDIVRTIAERYHYGDGTGVWYRIEGFGEETNFRHEDLKPVLPVEEKTDLEKILGCKLVADEKIPDGVIALVDSKGKVVAAIKDGYIVNL